MIPAGLTPAGVRQAAAVHGLTLKQFERRQAELPLPPLLNRDGARVRLWALEHLEAAKAGELVPGIDPDREPDPDDLLDSVEAYQAIPEEHRPTEEGWRTIMKKRTDTPPDIPKDDPESGVGVDLWRRSRMTDWPNTRNMGKAGRPAGATDRAPRKRSAAAEQRLARTREILAENPTITNVRLGAELGVTGVQAGRLRAAVSEEHADS